MSLYWNNSIQENCWYYIGAPKKIPKNKKRGIDIELELNDNEHTIELKSSTQE